MDIDINEVSETLSNATQIWFHEVKEEKPTKIKLGFDDPNDMYSYNDLVKLNRGQNPEVVFHIESLDKLSVELINTELPKPIWIESLKFDGKNLDEFKSYQKFDSAFLLLVGSTPASETDFAIDPNMRPLLCKGYTVNLPSDDG